MKCDGCVFNRGYTTGADEYPAGVWTSYCSMGHWSGDDNMFMPVENPPPDPWEDCKDYQPKISI